MQLCLYENDRTGRQCLTKPKTGLFCSGHKCSPFARNFEKQKSKFPNKTTSEILDSEEFLSERVLTDEEAEEFFTRMVNYLATKKLVYPSMMREFGFKVSNKYDTINHISYTELNVILINAAEVRIPFYVNGIETKDPHRKLLNFFRRISRPEALVPIETEVVHVISEIIPSKEPMPDICPVCTSDFPKTEASLSCGHWICSSCIVNSCKDICPICRAVLNLSMEMKEKILSRKLEKEVKYSKNVKTLREYNDHLAEYLEGFTTNFVDTEIMKKVNKLRELTDVCIKNFLM